MRDERSVGCVRLDRLHGVQGATSVTLRVLYDGSDGVVAHLPSLISHPLCPLKGLGDDRSDVVIIQWFEYEHATSRQQCPRQLEARVLGRRADERHDAVLDPRQERVLLRLVEAMDLVAEQDR